jgi:hypothetical protein
LMRTPSLIDDPAHWRRRVEEARRMADQIDDPADKKALMDIAAAYDQFIAGIEARLASKGAK